LANNSGNSNTQDRIQVLSHIDAVRGARRIKVLTMDRKLIDHYWLKSAINVTSQKGKSLYAPLEASGLNNVPRICLAVLLRKYYLYSALLTMPVRAVAPV
jgi:hypothetical protein